MLSISLPNLFSLLLIQANALAKIEAIGGLKKEDPNCVRKKQSPAFKERIRKRLLEGLYSVASEFCCYSPDLTRFYRFIYIEGPLSGLFCLSTVSRSLPYVLLPVSSVML